MLYLNVSIVKTRSILIMTLDRLIELYQAEKQGKQIMKRTCSVGFYCAYQSIEKVKIADYELNALLSSEGSGEYYNFFIKDEEDKYGNKINTVQ